MKKKILLRGITGIPVGITIGQFITIFKSLNWGQGGYYPCTGELIRVMGNEINAVLLQTVCCGLIGAVFAAGSVIWEMETWSIAKQTLLYFLVSALAMIPAAYFLYWMEHSLKSFLIYTGIFVFLFIFIWLIQYLVIMHNIKKINEKLK